MKVDESMKVGELVALDYRYAKVFSKYGMDFCCGGGKTINEACSSKGVNEEELLGDLQNVVVGDISDIDFNTYKLDKLIDHIVTKHHHYLRESMPILAKHLKKVVKVHSAHNKELIEIEKYFSELAIELDQHMMKEEHVLFPYISTMESGVENDQSVRKPPFGSIEHPVSMMVREHEDAGNHLQQIRELSGNFTPPEHACNTYIVTYKLLEELEEDLHKHIHLENNILFPKAIELEKKLESAFGE